MTDVPAASVRGGERFGMSGVLWLLANKQPLTVTDVYNISPKSRGTCYGLMRQLFERRMVVRREQAPPEPGGVEYEYAIAEYDNLWNDANFTGTKNTQHKPPFGQAGVMWLLATHSEPLTPKDMADMSPVEVASVRSSVKHLFRRDMIMRRKRKTGLGSFPFEYRIREYDGRWTDE